MTSDFEELFYDSKAIFKYLQFKILYCIQKVLKINDKWLFTAIFVKRHFSYSYSIFHLYIGKLLHLIEQKFVWKGTVFPSLKNEKIINRRFQGIWETDGLSSHADLLFTGIVKRYIKFTFNHIFHTASSHKTIHLLAHLFFRICLLLEGFGLDWGLSL